MNVNLAAPVTPRHAAGSPSPSASDAAASGPDAFATLLDREQAAPPQSAEPASDGEATQAAAERQAAQRGTRGAKTPARAAEKTAPPAHAARSESEARAADTKNDAAKKADEAEPDPALLHWLQGLNLPPATTAAPTAGGPEAAGTAAKGRPAARPGADTLETGTADPSARSSRGIGAAAPRGAGPERPEAAGERRIAAQEASAARTDTIADAAAATAAKTDAAPRFADMLATTRAGGPEAAAAAGPTTASSHTTPAAEVTPPASASVPVPLDDPQFPRAFGVQVSVLARDGVQQAELHLNPAEMGPVSVQIVMDGTQARIDFGADAAPTRALIEQSLPDLAAALREAGLTLAGGGVSQHAQSGRDPNGQAGSGAPAMRGEARAEAAATEPRAVRRNVSAGGVDLYA